MFKKTLAIALLTLTPLAAGAYEIGHLTCENIGQLADQSLVAKHSGIPQDVYVSALNERLPGDALVERKLVAAITTIVYQNDFLTAMEPADVYTVLQQDCLRDQAEDGVKGQEDNDEDGNGDTAGDEGDQDATDGWRS
jgi:hypothetical protein